MGFNPSRLTLARERAGLTKEELAQACKVTRRTVSDWEAGRVTAPPVDLIAQHLEVGSDFFVLEDAADVEQKEVSFRALSTMGARKAKRVIAAARISVDVSEWLDHRYELPSPDLPTIDDLVPTVNALDYSPEQASDVLRALWSLGDRPVKNMLELVERRGVRVLGLPSPDRDVDAFSFWHGGQPYMFVNPDKSGERLRFDLAHELGHLILHRGIATAREKRYELQANQFASCFLMPARGLLAQVATGSNQLHLRDVQVMKTSWKVSAVAMVRRLYDLGTILDWHYRSWMVDLSARGYRRGEPDGLHPEQSKLIGAVLAEARQDGLTMRQISRQSGVPVTMIEGMFQGLALLPLATLESASPKGQLPDTAAGIEPAASRRPLES